MEYSKDYCLCLEAAYSDSYMSEGGDEAVHSLFEGVSLKNKRVLEIGSGLGGAAFEVARGGAGNVIGLEINEYLVEESSVRIPRNLIERVSFRLYKTDIPLSDNSVDIVFSKGVLTHLEDKLPLFKEVNRVLVPGGQFLVNDWLSEEPGSFGPRIEIMSKNEGLILFAQNLNHYQEILCQSGLSLNSFRT